MEDHTCQFGKLALIPQGNRKPGNFHSREQEVQNWKIEILIWLGGLWEYRIGRAKKEVQKQVRTVLCHSKRKSKKDLPSQMKYMKGIGIEIGLDHSKEMTETLRVKKASEHMRLDE